MWTATPNVLQVGIIVIVVDDIYPASGQFMKTIESLGFALVAVFLASPVLAESDTEKCQALYTPGNYEQAMAPCTRAAGRGEGAAKLNLGRMYHSGQGVPQDYQQAYKWYSSAARQGYADAGSRAFLEDMYYHDKGIVENAGLVLLGSFLPMLYDRVGFLGEDGEFIDVHTRKRCVYLLQYIATGRATLGNSSGAINKVMCGLDTSESAGPTIEPTEQEREVSDQMLVAVIGYWTALGKQSVAGFRSTWLERDGALKIDGKSAYLSVEPRNYDVLLASTPLTYHTIKAPWMKVRLHTTW